MFFAIPEFSTKEWKIVNATFGLAKFFMNSLREYNPDYVFWVKDAKGPNFRSEIYEDYKATRERMPDNLRSQIDDIEAMIDSMWIWKIEMPWYEADDIIGTLATQFGWEYDVVILSGDKDLYSLVSENVKIYDTMKRKLYGPWETQEKYGVSSTKIIDYLAIMWDSADNIPGIDGFGPKKAVTLINSLWSIEEIYDVVDKVVWNHLNIFEEYLDDLDLHKLFKWKTFEKLVAWKESAFLSKKLATICLDIDLKWMQLKEFSFQKDEILNSKSEQFFRDFEFFSLLPQEAKINNTWKDTWLKVNIITNISDLKWLEYIIKEYKEIVLDTETTSLDMMDADLVGLSLYLDDSHIYYINVWHVWECIHRDDMKDFLKNLLSEDILIIGHNIKYDLEVIYNFLERDTRDTIDSASNADTQMSLI